MDRITIHGSGIIWMFHWIISAFEILTSPSWTQGVLTVPHAKNKGYG
jgi:hypothetical protein